MSEATNFKNNKTGQQIDLVDQNARDQIEELNETLTEWTIQCSTYEDFLNIIDNFTDNWKVRFIWLGTEPTLEITETSSYSYGIAVKQNAGNIDFLFTSDIGDALYSGRISQRKITVLRKYDGTTISQ